MSSLYLNARYTVRKVCYRDTVHGDRSATYNSRATSNVLYVTISSPSLISSNPSREIPQSMPFLISSTSFFKCFNVEILPRVNIDHHHGALAEVLGGRKDERLTIKHDIPLRTPNHPDLIILRDRPVATFRTCHHCLCFSGKTNSKHFRDKSFSQCPGFYRWFEEGRGLFTDGLDQTVDY